MTRNLVCSLALGALGLLIPAGGSAQTFVDVGVWTPGVGGRVVIGGAPVYRTPIYRAPVYRPVYVVRPPVYVVQPYYRHDRGRHRGWNKGYPAYGPYGAERYYVGYRYYDEPRYARVHRRR